MRWKRVAASLFNKFSIGFISAIDFQPSKSNLLTLTYTFFILNTIYRRFYHHFSFIPTQISFSLLRLWLTKSFSFYTFYSNMVKNVKSMQNWIEVAPSTFVSYRRSSSCPKLETIIEEGSNPFESFPKRVLIILPFLISYGSYFLLYRHF